MPCLCPATARGQVPAEWLRPLWFVKYEKGWSHSRKSCSKTDKNCKTALWEVRDELDVRHKLGHFYVIPRHFANGGCCSNKDSVSKQWLVHLSGSLQAQVLDVSLVCTTAHQDVRTHLN